MNLSWFEVNTGMEWTVLTVCGIVTIYWIAITLKCVLAQKRIHWLSPSLAPVLEKVKISVIMPARNEERDIASSLHSILNQKNVDLEVIVVNDHSNDRTGEIVDDIARSDSRLKVLHNPPLTKGWLGKCNAMQYGAAEASGDYLLFTDADILHTPGCFANVISVMQKEDYDFISLFPLFENHSFWENINIPIYFFGIAKLLATPGLENPDSSNAVASGALMLINTTVFHDIGGFQGVKGEMFDDIGLARLLKRQDYRVGYRLAPECLQVRLFKTNLDAFWGTTKNILGAVEGHVWLAIPLIFLGFLQNWMPLFAVVLGVLNDNSLLLVVGLITYGVQYLSFFSVKRLLRFHPLKLLFFPLVAIVAACCILRAIVSHTKGSILWRGREIKVRG
ncbi:MAG: glycosyltransferase [Candidatus Aegiribacteria sp.]|nr:glycosyltransferase [Candidatus Aegiribacteria sp.]